MGHCCVSAGEDDDKPTFFRETKQEHTKVYDLRRGSTEAFQRLTKLKRTLSKPAKNHHGFKRIHFLDLFDLQMTSKCKFDLVRPT